MQINEECVMIQKKWWKKNNARDMLQYVLPLLYKPSAEKILNIDVKG